MGRRYEIGGIMDIVLISLCYLGGLGLNKQGREEV